MKYIESFIKEFTNEFPLDNIIKINKKYFLVNNKARFETIDEDEIRYEGLFLGEEKNKRFNTSINLLNQLAHLTNQFIHLNSKTSWLFICGRDVFAENITDRENSLGLVIVKNNFGDIIGLARVDKKDKKLFKNLYDIGHFLRREKKGK